MWLINTDTLQLEDILKPQAGSYAILSHTWGHGEVSFRDFADLESAEKKLGFAKIKKTCQLARKKFLQYAWVDTCCIDNSSSAELSEAINSMFRWYREASVCFVYLSDTWFKRGWTLQELLAPRSIEFYNADWCFLAFKILITDHLSDITGIDTYSLIAVDSIWSKPVGTRMRWAAERETTRLEDIAYCLLGILDINMPLIYGEGEKAFLRLQEEICRQTTDMSLFAWTRRLDHPFSCSDSYRGIFAHHPCEFADFPREAEKKDWNCESDYTKQTASSSYN
ncbi:heterokaryon incompatibility protein-domain-containing protein [Hypoxylon fuscum]|nr:heterokaryon incompatibility protein-domain-containing protein [Hypoxylon fuscum]